MQLDGKPGIQGVEVKSLTDLVFLDLLQIVKIVNGLSGSREIELRSVRKALRGLHHGDVLVVGTGFPNVVRTVVVRAVSDPFVLRREPVPFAEEELVQVRILVVALERLEQQVGQRGRTYSRIRVDVGVPFLVHLVPLAVEDAAEGAEGDVDEQPDRFPVHRVVRVFRVCDQADVRRRVDGLDNKPVQHLVILDALAHLDQSVSVFLGKDPDHLGEPERAEELLVLIRHNPIFRAESHHVRDVVAVHLGEFFLLAGLLALQGAEIFPVVYSPDYHALGVAEAVFQGGAGS